MCPAAHGTINTPPVGATLAVARLPCTTLHGNPVIAKPVRTLAVAIRPPSPLPKGGWHGEAVTGGFFPRTSCNAFVGAGFYPARGRGRAPPLRTARYTSVGADASVRPTVLPITSP